MLAVAITALAAPVSVHKYPWIDPSCTDPAPPAPGGVGAQCGGVNSCGRAWTTTCLGDTKCVRSTEWWSSCLPEKIGKHITRFAGAPGSTQDGKTILGPWQQCAGQGIDDPSLYTCPGPDPDQFYDQGYECSALYSTYSLCTPIGSGSKKGTSFP